MRFILVACAVVVTLLCVVEKSTSSPALADLVSNASRSTEASPEAGIQIAGLKDTLEKGLRAYKRSDFVFINKVVTMVEANTLPLSVVVGTFDWVRKNRSHKKYLVPYFEQVLRSRAAQLGITIT